MSSKNTPTFARYFKAQLVPLARPLFWAPIGLLGLAVFVLWQYKNHPDLWTTTVAQPEGTQSRSISDPTFPIPDPLSEQEFVINPQSSELQPFVQPGEPNQGQDANPLAKQKSNSPSQEGVLTQLLKQQQNQASSDNGLAADPITSFFQPNYKLFKGNNSSQKGLEPVKPAGQGSPGGELPKFKAVPAAENPLAKAIDRTFSNNSVPEVTAPETTVTEPQPSLPQVQSAPRVQVNRPNYNPYAVQTPSVQQPQYNQPYSNPYAVQTPSVQQPQYNQPYSNPYAVQAPSVQQPQSYQPYANPYAVQAPSAPQPQSYQPYANPYAVQAPSAPQPQSYQPYANPDVDRTPSMQPTLNFNQR